MLLDGLDIQIVVVNGEKPSPPRLRFRPFLVVQIDDKDIPGTAPSQDAHVLAAGMIASVAIPAIERSLRDQIFLKLGPACQRRHFPFAALYRGFCRHHLKPAGAIHRRPFRRASEIWVERRVGTVICFGYIHSKPV